MKTETNHSLDLFHFKRLFIESLNFYFSAETRDEINIMENFPFYILAFSNIFLIILILKKSITKNNIASRWLLLRTCLIHAIIFISAVCSINYQF